MTIVEQHIGGFREAVLSVRNLDESIPFYQEVAGWTLQHRGLSSKDVNKLWQLPEEVEIEEAFLVNEGDNLGFLRLVCFKNAVNQRPIRVQGNSWDTGGIFDLDIRVKNIGAKFDEMIGRGWHPVSKPHRYTFEKFDVEEVLLKDNDGVVFALIQRHSPPLTGWENLREFSYCFNSTQVVKDFDKALHFYQDQLGFKIYIKSEAISHQPETNVLGIPVNVVTKTCRKVAILHPQGTNSGSVEILKVESTPKSHF